LKENPILAIAAHSKKEGSMAGYSVNSMGLNPVNFSIGFADSQMNQCYCPTIPFKFMVAAGFNKQPEKKPRLYPVNHSKRLYSLGRYSALSALNAVSMGGSFGKLFGKVNLRIEKFATKNNAQMGTSYSWGASFAGAELSETTISLARIGNSLIVIETDDEILVKLTQDEFHYLDGTSFAPDKIEWSLLPLNNVRCAAFFVSEEPILPLSSDVIVPEAMELFIDGIQRVWHNKRPKAAIKSILDEQVVEQDYALIIYVAGDKY